MTLALGNTSDLLLRTLDLLKIPVLLVKEDGLILSGNEAASGILLYDADSLPGLTYDSVVVSGQGAASSAGRMEMSCVRRNGETFPAEVTILPITEPGVRLVVIQDVTAQKKLRMRADQRKKELAAFTTFAGILAGSPDTGRILQETVDMLMTLMEADAGWVYLLDEASGLLTLRVQRGYTPAFIDEIRQIPQGEFFNGKVFSSQRPLVVERAVEDPRVVHKDPLVGSIIGVPVSSKRFSFGVIGLASRTQVKFTSMDTQLLGAIGSQLGVALENARLISQLNEQMKQIELINELSGMINSSLSIGSVFRIMMSEIRKLISYDRGSILLFDEKSRNLQIFALDTSMDTVLKKGVKAPLDTTSAGWVIRHNSPWINRDLAAEMRFPDDRKLLREGIRSTISIPLFQDRILGVLNLDSTEPGRYSEKDLSILLPVAKHMSIALENALLFEEISREKKEWEKTFDAITDMVWIEDGGQRVIRANKTLLMRSGLSSFQVMGKECGEVLRRIGIAPTECLCLQTVATKKPSFREIRGSTGGLFHFWAYPLVDDDGRLYAIVHYLKDVTAQKRLEHQLMRSEKLASLGTLVSGIAHEINNPLGIIAGYTEALLDRAKHETLREFEAFEDFPEYLDTIHNEIFRCKRILGSLLGFARPSGGTFREIDINELIKEVILLVNHRAKRLNHNVELRLNRDLPKVAVESGNLRQLFMNIVINSLYFTPEGGTIVISTDWDGSPLGRMIRVSISDSGPGIAEGIIGKVFDPFFTTKPVGEGTGLGLAICHKIVEEHGGTIDVESPAGSGTTVHIRLPAAARNDQGPCH